MEHMPDTLTVSDYLDTYYHILNKMEENMTSVHLTGSVSGDFIKQMIPHHEAAVEMCENLLRWPVMEPLADLARTIIRQQTRGIAEMRALLPSCGRMCNSCREACQYRQRDQRILETMFYDMAHVSGVGVEQNFLREMIPHNEGAVRMSENALRFPICRPLGPVLENIIATQEREIGEMRRFLLEMEE